MAVPSPLPFPGADAAPGIRRESLVVFVRGLEVAAGIGVHDHELGRLQRLVIDVSLDLAPAAVERLADTINYETVARVQRCTVRIEKPGALEGVVAPGCEVTLAR